MNPLRRLVSVATAAAAALVVAGCATLNVSSYVERGADFTRYSTYAWEPDGSFATGDPRLDNNPFFRDGIKRAVERELSARGYEKTLSPNADLILHYHASVTQQIVGNELDRGYAACDDCRPEVYDAGTLFIDFVDRRAIKVVWRGWAEGAIAGVIDNQDSMEETVDRAVTGIFRRFPGTL
jgi:hypothetical protein